MSLHKINLLNRLLFQYRRFVYDISPDGDVLAVLLVVVEQLLALTLLPLLSFGSGGEDGDDDGRGQPRPSLYSAV